jgi:hypothetical protein
MSRVKCIGLKSFAIACNMQPLYTAERWSATKLSGWQVLSTLDECEAHAAEEPEQSVGQQNSTLPCATAPSGAPITQYSACMAIAFADIRRMFHAKALLWK